MKLEATRQQLDRRKGELLKERLVWEDRWKDIRDNILPTHGWFEGDIKDGKRRLNTLANDTPSWSVSVMAAGMQSGLTSPNNQWFRLAPENPKLAESNKVQRYLTDCEEIMQGHFSKSGIYDAFYSSYEELGTFGIGGFLLLEDPAMGFIPVPLTIGEYAIGVNAQRKPCEFFRRIELTPAQMVEQFGEDAVSDNVKMEYKNNSNNAYVVNHLIAPNDGRIESSKGLKGKAFLSWYWEEGVVGDKYLALEGYEEFPAIISRWTLTGPNVYGFGLGEMSLGDCTQLQKIELDKITALQLSLRPPLAMPISMRGRVSLLPAAQNWYDPSGSAGDPFIKPLVQVTPNMQDTGYEISRIEERIKRSFYVQMFLSLLTDPNREQQKTATEINELHNEKLLMIGPVLQRLDREMLRPCIDRAYAILERQGLLPEPPNEIIGQAIKVEYLSPLILAQRMAAISAVDRFIGFISNVAGVDPGVLDNLNFDKTAIRYANDLGVPADLIRSDEEKQQMRESRAEDQQKAQQEQQMMEQAKVAPQALKTLSETEMTPDSILGQAAGALMQ